MTRSLPFSIDHAIRAIEQRNYSAAAELLCAPSGGQRNLVVDLGPLEDLAARCESYQLRRVEADDREVRRPAPWSAAVANLGAIGEPFAVAIDRWDGSTSVSWLFECTEAGVAHGRPAGFATFQSGAAPGTLLHPKGSRFALPTDAYVAGITTACKERPMRQGDDVRRASVLEALSTLNGAGWCFVARFDPADLDLVGTEIDRLDTAEAIVDRLLGESTQTSLETTVTARVGPERVLRQISVLRERLHRSHAVGPWEMRMYVVAVDEPTAAMVIGAVGAAVSVLDEPDRHWVTHSAAVVSGDDAGRGTSSFLTSDEVGELFRPPESSVGSLVAEPPPPAGRFQRQVRHRLNLGTWLGSFEPAAIDVEDLEGHGFITGTTGTGKTSTVGGLLRQLWNVHGIPFLVIDPAKSDYEELAPFIEGGLTLIDGADLAFNVLNPWDGFDPATHLGLVSNAFKGSFTMPSPTPYVLTLLFDRLAGRLVDRGPLTLHDLQRELERVMPELGYRGELEANIRASLGLRLSVLLSPARAERFAAAGNEQLVNLLTRPTVVQLSDLGDDEERAFLMSMLTLYVAEAAKCRGPRSSVAHVCVLEEAHRILPEPRASRDDEGDAGNVAAKQLTQLLAEIRSVGESILVVDQSPAAVARDVVRNTNLKIAHRIVDPEDRRTIGGALGLGEERSEAIGYLARGEVIVGTRGLLSPQTVSCDPPPSATSTAEPAFPQIDSHERAGSWPCCRVGHSTAEGHHLAEARADELEVLGARCVLRAATDPDAAARDMDATLQRLRSRYPSLAIRCATWVALNAAVRTMVGTGHLTSDAFELVRRIVEASHRNAWHRIGIAFDERASQLSRPFVACQMCDSPCRLAPLVQIELRSRSLRLGSPRGGWWSERNELMRQSKQFGMAVREGVDDRYASAATLCFAAHGAHRLGYGDAVIPGDIQGPDAKEAHHSTPQKGAPC